MEEVTLNKDNQKLLGINDVTSAFMIASEMGKKARSNQTIETLAEEEEEEQSPQETQEEEGTESRPGSGILQETLEEIEKEETLIENETEAEQSPENGEEAAE